MFDTKEVLKNLCEADGFGGLSGALDVAEGYLSKFASVSRVGNSLIGQIKGKGSYTVMLDAHIDEIGMVVTAVKNGCNEGYRSRQRGCQRCVLQRSSAS